MSNTKGLHTRFWTAMKQRYGTKRWEDLYGDTITGAWSEVIDKYTPDDIKFALGELSRVAAEFPPTLPQFEALLVKSGVRRRDDGTDYIRGYWRAMVVREIACNLGYTMTTLEPVIVANRATLGAAMRDVLDEMDGLEKRTGQRTEGMLTACRERCIALSECFHELETPHAFGRVMRQIRCQRLLEVAA